MIKVTPLYSSGILDENAYILQEDGCSAVVDPSFENPEEWVKKSDGKLTHILLTHGHFDHMVSARALRDLTGAKICIHEKDFDLAQRPELNLCYMAGLDLSVTADVKLRDGETIQLGGSQIAVLHTPGHTAGSCCYLCENALMSGDTLFRGSVGRLDFPTGSEAEMRASLKRLDGLSGDYILYPGHEEPSTLKAEKENNPYFEFLRKRI